MAKKIKLTPEEELKQHIKHDMEDAEREMRYTGAPSYTFKIGDKVRVGNLNNCVVDQVLYNGRAYGIKCTRRDNNYGNPIDREWYRVVSWVNVRPFNDTKESLAKNQDIRLDIRNYSIDNILNTYYFFGINMDPEYQRGYTWNLEDKVALIDSIFNNIGIGKIVLVHKDFSYYSDIGYSYEVLDGKQRIKALTEFYENRFPYKGKYYNDLTVADQHLFKGFPLGTGIIEDADEKTILKYFLLLNTSGKSMDKEHLEKVKNKLKLLE